MLNPKYIVPSTEAIGMIFIVFGKIWLGIEPTTSQSQSKLSTTRPLSCMDSTKCPTLNIC